MKLRLASKYVPLLATAAVLVGLYAAGCLGYRNFASLRVLVNLFGDNAFLGVAAFGATFVILSGGIDLSVGSVIAFTGIFLAVTVGAGWPPALAIPAALAIGVAFGAGMGCLIHFFDLPAFLVTLAGMFLARGMSFVIHPQSMPINHEFFRLTVVQDLAIPLTARVDLPFVAVCMLAVFLAALYLAHYTRFGRCVYAIGGSENSAKLMGLPVGLSKVLIYALAGLCSALAGVVFTFYTQSGNPASCVGLELDVIAAVVIGGTLLSGGVGYVAGTLMGVLILGLIQTIINFQRDLNTWWTKIAVGGLVLVFILLQNFVQAASRRKAA
jgi:galactofuranose transport system permease protein